MCAFGRQGNSLVCVGHVGLSRVSDGAAARSLQAGNVE